MNAKTIRQRTGFMTSAEKARSPSKMSDQEPESDPNMMAAMFGREKPKKPSRNDIMAARSLARRTEWAEQVKSNPEFVEQYRDTATMYNKEHNNFHSFREGHTMTGELGVMVRNYQTSQERAESNERYNKFAINDRPQWNEKLRDGPNKGKILRQERKVAQTVYKNTQHKQWDENSRAINNITEQSQASLQEKFDINAYMTFPAWKQSMADSQKSWLTSKGFDNHSGKKAPHVKYQSIGQAKVDSHQNAVLTRDVSNTSKTSMGKKQKDPKAWTEYANENKAGVNPFSQSHKEQIKTFFVRKRDKSLENLEQQFVSTCRPSVAMDDKVKIKTLNQMETMERCYNMQKATNCGEKLGQDSTMYQSLDDTISSQFKATGNKTHASPSPSPPPIQLVQAISKPQKLGIEQVAFMKKSVKDQNQSNQLDEQSIDMSICDVPPQIIEEEDHMESDQLFEDEPGMPIDKVNRYLTHRHGLSPRGAAALKSNTQAGNRSPRSNNVFNIQKSPRAVSPAKTPSLQMPEIYKQNVDKIDKAEKVYGLGRSPSPVIKGGYKTQRLTTQPRYEKITKVKQPRNTKDVVSIYEKWKQNPNMDMKLNNRFHSMSYRNTANHTVRDKTVRVDDAYLGQNLLPKKTYFCELKDKIQRVTKIPEYFPEKLSSTEYQRLALISAQSDATNHMGTLDEFMSGSHINFNNHTQPQTNEASLKTFMRGIATAGGSKPKYNLANYASVGGSSTNAETQQGHPPSSAGLNQYGMPLLPVSSRGHTTASASFGPSMGPSPGPGALAEARIGSVNRQHQLNLISSAGFGQRRSSRKNNDSALEQKQMKQIVDTFFEQKTKKFKGTASHQVNLKFGYQSSRIQAGNTNLNLSSNLSINDIPAGGSQTQRLTSSSNYNQSQGQMQQHSPRGQRHY